MRMLVASDLHGSEQAATQIRLRSLDFEVELIVLCGDITHSGDVDGARRLLKKICPPGVPILFVPGNWDPPALGEFEGFEGMFGLHGRTLKIGEICFGGIGGSNPTPFDTPFELSEESISQTLGLISASMRSCPRSVLVSHPPPAETSVDLTQSGLHVGSRSVREFIEKLQPDLVLCGHIHESKGKDMIGRSVILNPGSVLHGSLAVVEIEKEIRVKLEGF